MLKNCVRRRKIQKRRHPLSTDAKRYVYHDPCELGRGLSIYDAPRRVVSAVGTLVEASHNRKDALCCGSSLANTVINYGQQLRIAKRMTDDLEATGCDTIVTSCPQCNKAIQRVASRNVVDIAEVVARNISADTR